MPGLNPEEPTRVVLPRRSGLPGLPRRRRRKGRLDRLGLGVPAYAHPLLAPGEWAELARPGTPLHWVVINVSSGPGVRPDPLVREAAQRLREAGVRLLGYLDTDRSRRARSDLLPEAARHLEWYRVGGFFLDHVPVQGPHLPHYRRLAAGLRALTEQGAGHVVLNHGAHPDPGFAEIADQLVTFAGPWSDYRSARPPEWTADHPPERFCHLVHGVPRPHVETALRLARWQGAATVYLTDRPADAPWEGLPSYWTHQNRLIHVQPPPCH